jgi:hydroxyquinol 1,2-dioxygenase
MRNADEHSITQAVLQAISATPDARLRAISTALVRHVHDFVREIEPTQAEWGQAIAFLTRTGQLCSATRQEFILLSDALGVSMLVDAINHRFPGGATETTVLGPFHVDHAPDVQPGAVISQPQDGPPLLIEGSVKDGAGLPIGGALVDIWHADDAGLYDVQKDPHILSSRGRVHTDAHGNFHVIGAVPAPYPIPNDGTVGDMLAAQQRHPFRPAHVHFIISAPGMQTLVTHLFLHDSDYLESDVVFGVKESLIERLQPAAAGPTPYGAMLESPMPALRRNFVLAAAG